MAGMDSTATRTASESAPERGTRTFAHVMDDLLFAEGMDMQEKGRRFERLAKRFLEVEPKYADQFSQVWHWSEWPGRAGRPDNGVDIVAQDRYSGELVGVQVKFSDPEKKLQKGKLDSFFTEIGKVDFASGMVISTAVEWSSSAEAAMQSQSKRVTRVTPHQLTESTVDWSRYSIETPEALPQFDRKEARKYQREAIADVISGFTRADRGRLIMACGTGKTFTSLKLVEEMVPAGGHVLFLVPSIALLQQSLQEWTANAAVPLRPLAVCSDTSVGRRRDDEDISAADLGFPATTDPHVLATRLDATTAGEATTVVFSTYQSIDVIREAQQVHHLPAFDLVISDEAHRTTGITQPGEDGSAFTAVHDPAKISAAKRLYMTATPRIYVQEAKAKAERDAVAVFSMDDEDVFGPEFHRLGFGKAVEQGHLTDYKVLVLAVDTGSISSSFQGMLADTEGLDLNDAARIVGCWNGLAKRGVNGEKLDIQDHSPMRRAVAFARHIRESKKLADQVESISRQLMAGSHTLTPDLRMEASHVDGTYPMAKRVQELEWLKNGTDPNTVRILSNAKCLSEGVDVPTLDAVLFLSPRNSQVDVVQSVGRVMRKAEGKEYGYIILPIAVDAEQDPEAALADNRNYKVVWDVLQALRAHDDRFEAMVNKIDLGGTTDRMDIIGVGTGERPDDGGAPTSGADATVRGTAEALFQMSNAQQWRDAIFARMVRKVGDRRYWEDWAKDVKDIANRHVTRIRGILDGPDAAPREAFTGFLEGLRANLNDGISESDAIDMLSQHLITKPVFEALFEDYSFAAHNPVSQVMDAMVQVLNSYNLETEVDSLEDFYRGVRVRAEGIDSAEGKQRIITELYERFFKLAFPRAAQSLGIVYTPVQVVDFIIRAVDDVLQEHFGASISDEGVHVLDPFTGTGTFIVRLLQSGLIRPEDLLRKYTLELHANELLLMAYYIAAINIEATFHGLQVEAADDAGGDAAAVGYEPFGGIVLTDTFQMTEDGDTLDEKVFTSNNDRVKAQNALDIRVILGNPPYSVGQTSGNDDNANLSYPTLDESIRSTYATLSTAQNKNSLYDSYVRAIRWASDRVLDQDRGGVVCFVSNGGYIDGNTADGLRKTLYAEFHEIYVYNLRGNQRTAGEQSRREGGKIFDSGSRNTVAVVLLVKRPGVVDKARLHYKDIGDYLSREEKLALVNQATLASLDWQRITPNAEGDWINQRDERFPTFQPISAKGGKDPIFALSTRGLASSRDAWVYNSSAVELKRNVSQMVDFYNSEVERIADDSTARLSNDSTHIAWGGGLRAAAHDGEIITYEPLAERVALYRPFTSMRVQFQSRLNERQYRLRSAFPEASTRNCGIMITAPSSHYPDFSALMTGALPDLHLHDSGQFFPRYTYVENAPAATGPGDQGDLFAQEGAPSSSTGERYTRVDNITDATLAAYRERYGAEVTKDDVFYYVYGLLHSPEYRTRFAADLKKMLPRIPTVATVADFRAFADAGRALSELHIGYEDVEPHALTEHWAAGGEGLPDEERFRVQKMRYGGKAGAWDKTVL